MTSDRTSTQAASYPDDLRDRIARLERLLVTAYTLVVAALLLVGFFSPFMVNDAGRSDEESISLPSVIGLFFGTDSASNSDEAPRDALIVTGFIGLAVVVWLILLLALPAAAIGSLRGKLLLSARILVGLGLLGSLVPVCFSIAAISREGSTFGGGGIILLGGMIAALILTLPAAQPLVGTGRSAKA